MDYLLKSSAIIALFYICYRLLLQGETFFDSNRWFLFIGLITAAFLPLVVIPIYIEYIPVASHSPILFTESQIGEPETIDWAQLLSWIYTAITSFFALKLIIELASLKQLINKSPKKNIGRFSLIEIFDQIAPFSFFKWIVYNPKQFKKQELNYIINHEKIHAKEYHTIDILLAQLYCALFWFNPLVWLYKKELQQNLEFIADEKAQNVSDCKESYQRLLLKASVPNHPLVFTNNFYNSLIKKRIIMLHKSKSNKLNVWKYALIIPILALFLMSFNTKEIYVAKDLESNISLKKEFTISPKTTNSELEEVVNYFRNKTIKVKFSNITRNPDNTIKTLTLNTKHQDGTAYTKRITVSEKNKTIPTFKLSFSPGEDDIILNVLENDSKTVVSKSQVTFSDDKTIAVQEVKKYSKKEEKIIGENPLYVIGNKQYKKENLPSNKFSTNASIEVLNKKESAKRFGFAGQEGAIIVNGQASFYKNQTATVFKRGNIIITKDFSEADLNLAKAQLEKEGLKTKIRGVKRNSNGEIIAIKIEVSSEHSKASFNLNDDGPINTIQITFDEDGKNIAIGHSRMHRTHIYTSRAHNSRGDKLEYRKSNSTHVISEDHQCETDCEHDHDVRYEFHSDEEEGSEVIVRGNNAFVIKNSNTNDGVRTVTIENSKSEDEIIELKKDNNVYVFKSNDGKISSNNAVWVSDDDDHDVEFVFKKKKEGNNIHFSSNDNGAPYILLDGKEITRKELDDLDSDTIKSMNVLKGDSAVNKYGSKAKEGAIIITTKD